MLSVLLLSALIYEPRTAATPTGICTSNFPAPKAVVTIVHTLPKSSLRIVEGLAVSPLIVASVN